MNFNIITPLARFDNYNKLKETLKRLNVKWHIIVDDNKDFTLDESEDWISLYFCPNEGSEFWARCNNSVNWFIENHIDNENEYYGILNDDDSYEENFFNKVVNSLDKNKENDLIIVSMLRGHNIPKDAIPMRRHPTTTLFASPQNMIVGGVGVEQFFIKGKLIKNHKLPLLGHGDGLFIVELVKNYEVTYLPECYVLFNYFEPGRWNK
jgi:hypothetical protein